jgi:hypothetical protein
MPAVAIDTIKIQEATDSLTVIRGSFPKYDQTINTNSSLPRSRKIVPLKKKNLSIDTILVH